MKRFLPHFILVAAIAALLPACDRKAGNDTGDVQRQADEKRISELRDLEARQTQRDSDARSAQLDADRQKLADDQAALADERRRLDSEKEAVRNDADRQAKWNADEKRLADREAALRAEGKRADDERAERRQQQTRADARHDAAYQNLDSFYSALDPMGDWMDVEPYGYVWQPREAHGNWRPYEDGTWVYTDYGWTWKGNEPYGWATYHYGRWAKVRHTGWVWVPGSEWAPAWVSWRKGNDWVGWAPLPPEAHSRNGFTAAVDSYYDIGPASYNFVPVSRIGEPTYRGVVVEPERNVVIVNQTTNVTRINYTKVQNNTVIVNEGPDLQQINSVSARPVQRLRLERESSRERLGGGNGSNNVTGDTMRLLAPGIAPSSRAQSVPTRVKGPVQKADVERGWGTGDVKETEVVRAKMKQEASEAEVQARREPARPVRIDDPRVPLRDDPRTPRNEALQPVDRTAVKALPATSAVMPREDRPIRSNEPAATPVRPAAKTVETDTPDRSIRPPVATPVEAPKHLKATPVQEPESVPNREPMQRPIVPATPRATPPPPLPKHVVATPSAAPNIGDMRAPGNARSNTPDEREDNNARPTGKRPQTSEAPDVGTIGNPKGAAQRVIPQQGEVRRPVTQPSQETVPQRVIPPTGQVQRPFTQPQSGGAAVQRNVPPTGQVQKPVTQTQGNSGKPTGKAPADATPVPGGFRKAQ